MSIDEVMIAIIGLYITIIAQVAGIAYWLGRKFMEIDARFRDIDRRFKEIDKRFEEIDRRFEAIDKRFEVIDRRFGELEHSLREEIRRMASSVLTASMGMNSLIVDFLALKGLITDREKDFLKGELGSIAKIMMPNPLSKEEVEFIKGVLLKPEEEITIEELDKVIEIAKRWFIESGKEIAYKLWLYTYMYRAALYYERLSKKEKRSEQEVGKSTSCQSQ